jgi:hypothetical protein
MAKTRTLVEHRVTVAVRYPIEDARGLHDTVEAVRSIGDDEATEGAVSIVIVSQSAKPVRVPAE